jgi:hypothetical protein
LTTARAPIAGHKDRCGHLRKSYLSVNRGQGLGFVMCNTVIGARALPRLTIAPPALPRLTIAPPARPLADWLTATHPMGGSTAAPPRRCLIVLGALGGGGGRQTRSC